MDFDLAYDRNLMPWNPPSRAYKFNFGASSNGVPRWCPVFKFNFGANSNAVPCWSQRTAVPPQITIEFYSFLVILGLGTLCKTVRRPTAVPLLITIDFC